jgi:hypothetical protein
VRAPSSCVLRLTLSMFSSLIFLSLVYYIHQRDALVYVMEQLPPKLGCIELEDFELAT